MDSAISASQMHSNILEESFKGEEDGPPSFLDETGEDDSCLSSKSFHEDDSILKSDPTQPMSSLEMTTPSNIRTMPSIIEEMTPGTFFAERSGNLGRLGGSRAEERPIWFTPRKDENGKIIDVIGDTPAGRLEKKQLVIEFHLGSDPCWSSSSTYTSLFVAIC